MAALASVGGGGGGLGIVFDLGPNGFLAVG